MTGGRVRTPAPTGIVGEKRRAHSVRSYKRERGKLPPHPPPSGAPFPIPSVPSGHHPYPFWPSAISP